MSKCRARLDHWHEHDLVIRRLEVVGIEPEVIRPGRSVAAESRRRVAACFGAVAGFFGGIDERHHDVHPAHVQIQADQIGVLLPEADHRCRYGAADCLQLGLYADRRLRRMLTVDNEKVETGEAEKLGDGRSAHPELRTQYHFPLGQPLLESVLHSYLFSFA